MITTSNNSQSIPPMKTNKIKILWTVIALLALLNGLIVGTTVYHNHTLKNELEDTIQFEPGAQPINGQFFRQTLGFTNEQMIVFREENRLFHRKANQIIGEMNRRKEELLVALQTTQPDTIQLKIISQEIGALHGQLKEITVDFYLSLRSVCDPDQKERLTILFEPMFQQTPLSGDGRRGQGDGYGQGRRNRIVE